MSSVDDLPRLLYRFREAHYRYGGVWPGRDVRPLIPLGEAAKAHTDFGGLSAEDRAEVLTILGIYRRQVGKEDTSLPAFDAARDDFAAALALLRGPGISKSDHQKGWVLVEVVETLVERYSVSSELGDIEAASTFAANALGLLDRLQRTKSGSLVVGPMLWDGSAPGMDSLRCRNTLGRGFALAFRRAENSDLLDRAIYWHRSAVIKERFDEYTLRDNACELVSRYLERFSHYRSLHDLDEAVAIGQRLVTEVPVDGPRPDYRIALARSLFLRYENGGAIDDFRAAFDQLKGLTWPVQTTGAGVAGPGPNLDADAVIDRSVILAAGRIFAFEGPRDTCEEASLAATAFPQATSAEASARLLVKVASAFRRRADLVEDAVALEHSIRLLEETLEIAGIGLGLRSEILRELAAGLRQSYIADGEKATIDRAVTLARDAVLSAPPDPELRFQANLELAQCAQKRLTGPDPRAGDMMWGRLTDFDEVSTAYRESVAASLSADLFWAIEIAHLWGYWESERARWEMASQAFRFGIVAQQRLRSRELGRVQTLNLLHRSIDLGARAAYALVAVGDHIGAVAALEKGRAILSFGERAAEDSEQWIEDIWGDDADLIMKRFEELKQEFIERNPEEAANIYNDNFFGLAAAFREVADAVSQEVRTGSLALSSGTRRSVLAQVSSVARDGEVVYLLSSDRGGLAIIVDGTGNLWVKLLADLSEIQLRRIVKAFYAAYERRNEDIDNFRRVLGGVSRWLGEAVFEQLRDVCREGSRLALVLTGKIGLLPVGISSWMESDPKAELPSRVTYAVDEWELTSIPTAAAYGDAISAAPLRQTEPAFLVDDPQPLPDGFNPLLASSVECEAVRQHFDHVTSLAREGATQPRVLDGLRNHGVVHLSCHGIADLNDPWQSGVVLGGGARLRPGDLFEEKLETPRLVVLSACESAVVGQQLPDEAVGLPIMILAAGVPGVIGTLWQVSGPASCVLMLKFYQLWKKQGDHPIASLRAAQKWVRDSSNGEKLDELRQLLPADFLATEAYATRLVAYLSREPQKRAFSDPYFWGSFLYIGT
jgi:hypothetical protein